MFFLNINDFECREECNVFTNGLSNFHSYMTWAGLYLAHSTD